MLGVRQMRAIGLIAVAVIAVTAVSFAYLRPAGAAEPRTARQAAGITWTESQIVQNINQKGRTDGGYFVWNARHAANKGSGGHSG
jgi:hypothetical protein